MKRFMLFEYDDYYPRGAMNDFVDSFDELTDVVNYVNKKYNYTSSNIEILDLKKKKLYILYYDWSCGLWQI